MNRLASALASKILASTTLALTILTGFSPLVAEEQRPPRHLVSHFYWENDAYVPSDNTDQFYTNGLRYVWLWNPAWIPEKAGDPPRAGLFRPSERQEQFLRAWCRVSHLCPKAKGRLNVGHALGQNMYTPVRLDVSQPQPFDRPWAGYLYFSWLLSMTHFPSDERDVENTFELQVGVVGPHSAAVIAQKGIHDIFEWTPPQGWRHQLRNEPTLNLSYSWRKRFGNETIDIVPGFGLGLGNVAVYGSAGATVRLGKNLSGFPQTLIVPATAPTDSNRRPKAKEYFVFVGAEGRAVGHNIFLDGNVLVDGPEIRIDREDFVYDLKAGFSYRCKAWRFDYTFVRRSEEFTSRLRRDPGPQEFGSFAISKQWWIE